MGTVLEGTGFVEVVEVMVVDVPVGTGLQGVLVEGVLVGDVVVPADTVLAGTWGSISHPAYWMSTGLLECLPQDSSVMTVPEDATAPETGLGGTAVVSGQREAGLVGISSVAGLVIYVGALGGQDLAELSTFDWVVVVDGDPVSQGKGVQHVGSEDQYCAAHHNNGCKNCGDFLDQLPWAHL